VRPAGREGGDPEAGGVDLHAHTTASDGTLTPAELVAEADRHGVRVLAITDHDSTDGVEAARKEAIALGMRLVPGVEINCGHQGAEIHVLGYFVDRSAGWFQSFLAERRAERVDRIHRILDRLAGLGMAVDAAEVFALAGDGAPGRPHIARALVSRGYVRSTREAFDRFLAVGRPANVPFERLPPAEAVARIRAAHGIPVLAHPGRGVPEELLTQLAGSGLLGIECYHPQHTRSQTERYLRMCEAHGWLATGGSDFHGSAAEGKGPPGTPAVPLAVYRALLGRARAAGSPVDADEHDLG
jgi:predicted metal-dependent phosphoesterase TrpH